MTRTSIAAPRGVNLAGYLRTESGVGAAARGYVRAFEALDIPIALHDLSHLTGNRSEDRTITEFATGAPYDLNLVCADVEPHFAIVSDLGPAFFDGRYNIGAWAWELPRFPEKWYDRFAYYDEIWVATSFVAAALAPVSPIPVVRIPPVLTMPATGSREAGRRRLGVAPDEFVFLLIFDVHSHLARKNPQAVVEAFRLAFRANEKARLILKCVNASADREGIARLAECARGQAISIIDGYWPTDAMRDLMAACDAYVSLHRAEGTGLTLSDAMALGKPVIATGWSGNLDFMTVANSYLVDYRLVEIDRNVGPYRAGEIWAEPSVEHAATLMRQVFDQPEEAQERGRRAQLDITASYAPAGVGNLIRQRFEAIATRRQLDCFRERMWARYWDYRELGDRIEDVVRRSLPPDATLLVVSKGDDRLLRGSGRTAWHFPRLADGTYAGYYPADSAEAIEQVEALRAQGGRYLLFPATAYWWLDHYAGLRNYLETRYRRAAFQPNTCFIYCLEETRPC